MENDYVLTVLFTKNSFIRMLTMNTWLCDRCKVYIFLTLKIIDDICGVAEFIYYNHNHINTHVQAAYGRVVESIRP